MALLLDTSALLVLRGNEPGADEVEKLIAESAESEQPLLISFMSQMELLYLIQREEGDEAAHAALRLIDSFNIEWVSCDQDILEMASRLKAEGGLSVADAWIAATALVRKATLIHTDPEFAKFRQIPQKRLTRQRKTLAPR